MNNSFIAFNSIEMEDKPQFKGEVLHREEQRLIAIIEACVRLANNPDWLTLKEHIFDGVIDSIKKRREVEIEKQPINGPKVHHLNGQLEWAKKYSDILTVAHIYKQELELVRRKLDAERSRNASGAGLDSPGTDHAT